MVREAITGHSPFAKTTIETYAKGSYANNTNVRLDSDVDIVVECRDCMYYDYGTNVAPPSQALPRYEGSWTPDLWRQTVAASLVAHFGEPAVDATGNVAILISEQPGSRPSIDVVPSYQFRRYWATDRTSFTDGTAVYPRQGTRIVNWPRQQLDNGRTKNDATGRRYKNYVRALKNAENHLVGKGSFSEKPSYLMECIIWNVPDATLSSGDLDEGFRATLLWAWQHLTTQYVREEWLEPNKHKYVFGQEQKWTIEDAKAVVTGTWALFEYGQ